MMNTLVVYFSKFGNTQMVAEAVAEGLQAAGSVQLVSWDALEVGMFQGVDLLVMGSPTHNMNLPKVVAPLFKQLPRRLLKGVQVAVFDTSYKLSWWLRPFTAAKRLASKLRKLGGGRIVPPETFFVTEREGPLYDGEIERAKRWSNTILSHVHAV